MCLYRAIDQFGHGIDVLVSEKRDMATTHRFFTRITKGHDHMVSSTGVDPARMLEYPGNRAPGYPFDPPPVLRVLQQQGPLAKVRLADGSTPWVVTRHGELRSLLADARLSADPTRPGYPRPDASSSDTSSRSSGASLLSFLTMDDPEHARLRRMVSARFAIKRIAAMRPAVQEIVDRLIDDLLAGPTPVDLVEAFALPVPSLVICELLGVPYADHGFFHASSKAIVSRDIPPEQAVAAVEGLVGYLDSLVGDRLTHPRDDLLSTLAERVKAGELARQDATQVGVLLLLAGYEATANMIALGTLALLRHPDQLAILRQTDDPELIAGAVDELLRFLNIVQLGLQRTALEDIEIGGLTIRAGEGVILLNGLGNRDPAAFGDDADRLDIRRPARHHVALGFGTHQCLGQSLVRMELLVVYGTLYQRIPTLTLAAGLDQIRFKHDGMLYGVYELPVTW